MTTSKDQSNQDREEKLNIKMGIAPNCFISMQGRLTEFNEDNNSLTIAFPVLENYLNPAGSMQGGYITAAFDNVFGPLCQAVTGTSATTTVDINTSYHRPIFAGDELIVTAAVKLQGRSKIHMVAEAFNKKNKLIATATTNYIHVNRRSNGEE